MGNYSEYTTKIFLNDNEAENELTKLKELEQEMANVRK
jgi:hypothetical protein